VLAARGISQVDDARSFLSPSESSFSSYVELPDGEVAAERIARAVASLEKIVVHGDYDVDGLTATALVVRTLKALGAEVSAFVPHRQREGYGLRCATIEELRDAGANLIITVDCGSGAKEEIELAQRLGIEVVVTDHHCETGDRRQAIGASRVTPGRSSGAVAIVNPKRLSSLQSPASGLQHLAGVGVAYKVCEGVVAKLHSNVESYRLRFLDLVALGTVADVVPLTGENRALVKLGLTALAQTKKAGIRALARVCDIDLGRLDARGIAFGLAPPLNAAGRIDDAKLALDLLLATDEAEAARLAESLKEKNDERRAQQQSTFAEAIEMVESSPGRDTDMAYVLASDHWHPGVIGIVASKLVDEYLRPVFIMRVDDSGTARGSARSPAIVSDRTGASFDVVEALRACSDLLVEFGGHARAGGFSLAAVNERKFSERIRSIAADVFCPDDLYRVFEIDTILQPGEMTWKLAKELEAFAPFGEGNPEPLFLAEGMQVRSKNLLGTGEHVRLRLAHASTPGGSSSGSSAPGSPVVDAIGFGMSGEVVDLTPGDRVSVCFSLSLDSHEGLERAQMVIRDLRRL
jgi:single-stranded-DNA-specific exonuclease